MIDFFEQYEELPDNIKAILANYGEGLSYSDCEELISELNKAGWDCDYDLSAIPYGLRPLKEI